MPNAFKVRSVGQFKCMIVGVQTGFVSDVVCLRAKREVTLGVTSAS